MYSVWSFFLFHQWHCSFLPFSFSPLWLWMLLLLLLWSYWTTNQRERRRRRRRRGTEIFFYFLGGVVSSLFLALSLVVLRRVGPAEERSDLVIRYGSHKKVEIFDWWKLKTVSKWVGRKELGYFKWCMMSDKNWVRSDEWWKKNPNKALIFLEFVKNFITQLI